MTDIELSLIVIAGTALLTGIIFLLVARAKKERLGKLRALAERHGWQFDPIQTRLSSGYTLSGERWTLQVLTQAKGVDVEPHTFNVSSETVFNAQVPTQPGRYILVGPAPVGVALGMFGERLQKRIIEQYLGPQAAGVRPVQAGSSTFMQRFMIFASEPARVPDLVTPGFEAWMTRWEKHKPVAKLTPDGLEIRLADVALKQPEDVETLVEVGESLSGR